VAGVASKRSRCSMAEWWNPPGESIRRSGGNGGEKPTLLADACEGSMSYVRRIDDDAIAGLVVSPDSKFN
jgi:hypothetical protein